MNVYALHDEPGRGRAQQWAASAIAIVAAHLVLIAAALAWYQQAEPPGVEMPAILVDLSPAPAAPAVQPQDLAPGPTMQQAPEPAEPEQPTQQPQSEQPQATEPQAVEQAEPQPQPVPIAPSPAVALPPPAKAVDAAKPVEPAKQAAKPKPEPKRATRDEAKRKRADAKPEAHDPPAPRSTAAPRAERQAALQSAQAGRAAAAAALPSYRDRLAAHLARYKQYPSASKSAGEQGTALLSFTVGRSGRVLASRLARSSGHPALDAETLAMIRRAQPLPSFPPEMAQPSLSFTVPINFSLR